jgi:nuclear pore complex protein Nup62
MDEIITRWAADLSKYQKEFQSQAEMVAKWDASIVENTDKINKLYSKTFQAERDAAEVERQLRTMEDSQTDLDHFLDRYEKQVDEMLKLHNVGGDSLRGPDQERERTYKLAEKLQDRLNELNKDLTEMIEEINNTSQTLSKTGKPDDPVSGTPGILTLRLLTQFMQLTKVVRVLNSQLSQLQAIDTGAAQLQEKINKTQKESQRMGGSGWNGLGTDPSDDFARSFRGGRTNQFNGVS